MKGYVQNATNEWRHIMKRPFGPNQRVTLEELYEQYGYKHDLNKGNEFITWLREVKLRDRDAWQIVIEDEVKEVLDEEVSNEVSNQPSQQTTIDNVAPMVTTKLTVEDVVELSVRKARERLPNITDAKLLKYALQEANNRANKDSLCRLLRKRIRDIEAVNY